MSISFLVRKNLWSISGNKCAICKADLFQDSKEGDKFNIGEECHIISKKKNGPRYKSGLKNYDTLDNLILLCRNHHKEVDDLPETYSEEVLRFFKVQHENWVKSTLDDSLKSTKKMKPRFLTLMNSGKDLFNIISGSHGYRTDYDDVENKEEAEYIGGVLQNLTDYGDISDMMEVADKVEASYQLGQLLEELASKGYFLYAESHLEHILSSGKSMGKWPIATIVIKKASNHEENK